MSTTRSIKASEARSTFSSLINGVYRTRDRIVVEKSGVAVAGIVSMHDLELLELLDRERDDRFRVLDEIRAAFADVDPEELEREAEKAIAEVRRKRRSAGTERRAS